MGAHSTTKNATSSINVASGGLGGAWTNPANAAVENGSYATITIAVTQYSDYLRGICGAMTYIGPSATATITGVECQVLGFADFEDTVQITEAKLWNGLSNPGSAVAAPKPIPITEEWGHSGTSIGSDGEMWGLSAANLKTAVGAKFFGFQFYVENIIGPDTEISIDAMRVIIYYDLPRRLNLLGCGR